MGSRVYLLVREQRMMIADSNNQLIFVFTDSVLILY
jgi:hypothetical protein